MIAMLRAATLVAFIFTITGCSPATPAKSVDKSSAVPAAVETDSKTVKLFDAPAEACERHVIAGKPMCVDTAGRLQECFRYGRMVDHPARPLRVLANCAGALKVAKEAYERKSDGGWILEGATVFKGPSQS